MGLLPWDADRLTPAELLVMAEAHGKRQEERARELAELAWSIERMHREEKLKPLDHYVRRPETTTAETRSAEQARADYEYVLERLGNQPPFACPGR